MGVHITKYEMVCVCAEVIIRVIITLKKVLLLRNFVCRGIAHSKCLNGSERVSKVFSFANGSEWNSDNFYLPRNGSE